MLKKTTQCFFFYWKLDATDADAAISVKMAPRHSSQRHLSLRRSAKWAKLQHSEERF